MDDGERLPLRVWPAAGPPRAVIIALHGFNDYSIAFDAPAAWWADQGVTTYAYDQRGFGKTAHRGLWPGTARMVADLRIVTEMVTRRHRGAPIYLVGESMGGAVALTALAEAPLAVDGVVLSAPAVWGRSTMSPLYSATLWLAAHTFPANRLTGRGLKRRASDNDEALRQLSRDPLVIKETRIDAIYGLVDLMDEAMASAARFDTPALMLYGARDEIVPKEAIETMLARHRGPRRMVLYPDGWHLLLRDLQAAVVWRDILAWIDDPSQRLPSGFERKSLPLFAEAAKD